VLLGKGPGCTEQLSYGITMRELRQRIAHVRMCHSGEQRRHDPEGTDTKPVDCFHSQP